MVVKSKMQTFDTPDSADEEEGMALYKKAHVRKLIFAGFVFFCLFIPAMALAGSSPVVTVGDSSSGGAVNFEPIDVSVATGGGDSVTDSVPGEVTSVEIASGVTATSVAAATNSGVLGMDQIASGIGVGGSVVILSAQSVENVIMAATEPSVLVEGVAMAPEEVLLSTQTALNLSGLFVTLPNNVEVSVLSTVLNTGEALDSNDPVIIGTSVNDALVVLSQAIKADADLDDIRNPAEAIAVLRAAVLSP